MSEREQLIEKLVCEMHLNVSERAALLPKTVSYSELGAVIRRTLQETGYFPPNARPWQEGKPVYEGAILEKVSNRKFRLTVQRSHPTAPHVLAAKKERNYLLVATAIRAFIRATWPNGIDGINIR
jgi:hypothetical protein